MNLLFTAIVLLFIITIAFIKANKISVKNNADLLFKQASWILLGLFISALLMAHLFSIISRYVDYKEIVIRRNAIHSALIESRKVENNIESAAVLKDIIDFNTSLAKMKYYNKTFLLGQYVDDRIESIEPIK